ncbi:MAG: hypothetical protein IKQ80_07555 [Clostridia bacterium]|nr:hypothetical protein [Clostridia bacterium]MBR6220401.1 hypothetical protein [Clostridia bacterium]
MNRLISILIIILYLTGIAIAEQEEPSLEGEWYVGSLFSERFRKASLDEDNVFHVKYAEDEATFYPDGTVSSSAESETMDVIALSDMATLYYALVDGLSGKVLSCSLFLNIDGEYRCYEFSCANKLLLIGGKIISDQKSETMQYSYSRGRFYMAQDSEYESGVIQWHGDDMFIFETETEIQSAFGSLGLQWIAFISTSIN